MPTRCPLCARFRDFESLLSGDITAGAPLILEVGAYLRAVAPAGAPPLSIHRPGTYTSSRAGSQYSHCYCSGVTLAIRRPQSYSIKRTDRL
ncbi:hypothetical protein NDU88_010721 [Pleurodeles waltl]|uniref:Uncharacterized protein n=1 Tax=Pleurodeles waltl TaxID=8319 RepID=A0AAV7QYB4_PLEWA|nr:hypothetical protein NDU88_010721 [Pleurodeles waltl]